MLQSPWHFLGEAENPNVSPLPQPPNASSPPPPITLRTWAQSRRDPANTLLHPSPLELCLGTHSRDLGSFCQEARLCCCSFPEAGCLCGQSGCLQPFSLGRDGGGREETAWLHFHFCSTTEAPSQAPHSSHQEPWGLFRSTPPQRAAEMSAKGPGCQGHFIRGLQ